MPLIDASGHDAKIRADLLHRNTWFDAPEQRQPAQIVIRESVDPRLERSLHGQGRPECARHWLGTPKTRTRNTDYGIRSPIQNDSLAHQRRIAPKRAAPQIVANDHHGV